MTRDELVTLSGGEICGGNVVKNNVCYGKMTEGVFTLTKEGEELIAAQADKPAKAPKAKKPAAKADEAPAGDEIDVLLADVDPIE